jgi:hypothetical protein
MTPPIKDPGAMQATVRPPRSLRRVSVPSAPPPGAGNMSANLVIKLSRVGEILKAFKESA